MFTCLNAAAKASIAAASFPGVLAASWDTEFAINISEAPVNKQKEAMNTQNIAIKCPVQARYKSNGMKLNQCMGTQWSSANFHCSCLNTTLSLKQSTSKNVWRCSWYFTSKESSLERGAVISLDW